MRHMNENSDDSLWNICTDDGVEHFEKGDGCIILDYPLVF